MKLDHAFIEVMTVWKNCKTMNEIREELFVKMNEPKAEIRSPKAEEYFEKSAEC